MLPTTFCYVPRAARVKSIITETPLARQESATSNFANIQADTLDQ